jgi:hypothetical protein
MGQRWLSFGMFTAQLGHSFFLFPISFILSFPFQKNGFLKWNNRNFAFFKESRVGKPLWLANQGMKPWLPEKPAIY